ncbi:MAG: TIGR03936 family radical SAM-associated protein [Bacteroidales bacterium]|nr:TIGR03936 family radical SAM-associated protein [Candidatus Latescibacterota bacterium]
MNEKTDRSSAGIYYDGILPGIEKPSRYIDRELNLSCEKFREGGFNTLLVFPDVYEIGMTHQGLRFLYHKLAEKDFSAEYAFSPWPDMEKLIRASGGTVRSWQTGTQVSRFDLIGITIPYELHYTNILAFLDMAGLSLEAGKRRDDDPLVVAGGPCTTNPLPILPAFDAIFLGDGEESFPEAVDTLSRLKEAHATRREMKEALASIDGVYVEGISERSESRVYILSDGDLPREPIVPSASIVHERLSVEILRGCTRGCRFCHAGMAYRPRRERSVKEIVEAVKGGLDSSGWEEVSLLSLSSSDYSRFSELIEALQPELLARRVSLALPSLRPETVCEKVVSASSAVRKSGFTLAPEAGTQRLRDVINKGMTEDEILQGCSNILSAGWHTLKLYFMMGLPTETREDLEGIADLVEKITRLPGRRRRLNLNVSVSPFVPRVNTPFQWEDQCTIPEMDEKQRFLRSLVRNRDVKMTIRDPQTSALEGIFARGTTELWPVLVSAFQRGCRFDGWRDWLDFAMWESILGEYGFAIDGLLSGRPVEAPLPWERFGLRVTKEFLLLERERAFKAIVTEDCRTGACHDCGACRSSEDKNAGKAEPGIEAYVESDTDIDMEVVADSELGQDEPGPRYRIIFEKIGRARFLSHRELINIFQRALRRSGLPVRFTGGFHPISKMSLGPSLPVGSEGTEEFFDVEMTREADVSPELFNKSLPGGVRVTDCGGPFMRKVGRLPEDAIFTYSLDTTPLMKGLFLSSDSTEAGGMEPAEPATRTEIDDKRCVDEVQWTNLGKELGESRGHQEEYKGLPEDPAAWLAGRFSMIFASGDPVTDRRGRERICDGCSVTREDDSCNLELSVPFGGRPGPLDLLRFVLPGKLSELVIIRRTGILFRKDDNYIHPMDLIDRAFQQRET